MFYDYIAPHFSDQLHVVYVTTKQWAIRDEGELWEVAQVFGGGN